MDEVIKEFPKAQLDVYYGIEHLHKYGPHIWQRWPKNLKPMMDERPYVKYHGQY
jgi:hypothetical protein